MKIVVRESDIDSWWELISFSGKQVAVSSSTYSRRSGAKKAATRVAKELSESFYYAPFNGVQIDVEDPR